MTKQITFTAEFELEAFYPALAVPAPGEGCTLSGTFGFASDEAANDATAKDDFEDFLKVVKEARFLAYRFAVAVDNTITLSPAGDVTVSTAYWAPPAGLPLGILQWLDVRSGKKWISQTSDSEINYKQIAAPHLLDTASGWDAPLPELAGVMRLVRLTSMSALEPESLIIVPWFDGNDPGAIEATLVDTNPDTGQIDVALSNVDSGGLSDIVIRTRSLLMPPADQGSLLDETTGYLKVRPRSNDIANALKRVRERSPSLLWTLPQLIALDWNDEAVDAQKNPAPDLEDLKRALWLGVSGLMSLFDPLLVALTMAGTKREGPFVAAFIALLEQFNDDPKQVAFGPFDTKGLGDKITMLVVNKVGQGATASDQAQFLARAFDLGSLPKTDGLDAEDQLLPVLLALHANFTPATLLNAKFDRAKARNRFGNSFDRQVIVELGSLAKVAQDEDAMEAAALRALAFAGITAEWLQGLLKYPNAVGALDRCKEALTAYGDILNESFNGLDATRFAQGSLFEAALVAEAEKLAKADGWDDLDLEYLLIESNWFAMRLGLGAGGAGIISASNKLSLAMLAAALPTVNLDYLDDNHEKRLHVPAAKPENRTGTLDKALKAIVAEIFPREKFTRFLPDPSPRDMPVQIAVDTDTDDGDTFQSRFNGVALLVRRESETWRYANLATLTQEYPQDGQSIDNPVIHPLQPVAVDSQRRLFVDYAGVPLASRVFEQTFAGDATDIKPEDHTPFYDIDDPPLPSSKRLPALAYGKKYSIAAHVLSKAGVLPVGQQRYADRPWLPKEYPQVPKSPADPNAIVRQELYLRTTAVGRVMLSETPLPGTSRRIGVTIDDVVPLASDYPRLALTAPTNVTTMLDVLRNADGTGAITLPIAKGERFDLNIADLWWWGKSGQLTVEVLNQANALPTDVSKAIGTFTAAAFAGGSIALRIESDGANRVFSIGFAQTPDAVSKLTAVLSVAIDPNAYDLGGPAPAWLRLRLKGAGASISFADPTGQVRTDHSASRPGTDSLLLLAPSGGSAWRGDLTKQVLAQLRFPQVGFVDFDRWFSNDDCRALAFPQRAKETAADAEKRRAAFHQRIMTAYLGRMLDPGLASLVDSMPDLAVSGLQLTLCAVDGLADKPSKIVTAKLDPEIEVIQFVPLGERPELAAGLETHKLLKALATSWGANVVVTCGGTNLKLEVASISGGSGTIGWQVNVNVPPGVIARLNARAMVSESFFGEGASPIKVFDDGIRQLAVGYADKAYLFDGPSLTVEGMLGELLPMADPEGWIDLSRNTVEVVHAGRARSYDLIAGHAHDEVEAWNWRKLGSIDVQTQRWRYTGRPIYSWFDPKGAETWDHPAGRIADDTPGLDGFETETFFDRDAQDADIQRKQIDPAPAATVLQSFPWDAPSATMFRHRLTLRSRYAGALLPGRVSTQKGFSSTQKKSGERVREDWIRVAMLADRTRLQLTRPQVRALMPLTVNPSEGDSDAAAPPVMAVLEEPPFVHGGLADRISAEIRTGFGFGFDDDSKDVVHIVDSRKEIGPDGRLTYAPTPRATARALTLESEGPLGLTFDTPTAPAPVFANSALLLRPRLALSKNADAGSLEEHFLSVGFRRYLDHRWLTDEGRSTGNTNSIATPSWIEVGGAFKLTAGGLDVLEVKQKDGLWQASVNPVAVDPKGPPKLAMKELSIAGMSFAGQLALLHLPLEEGRSSLTLYALSGSAGSGARTGNTGQSNLPHVLASFEWHVPDGVTEITLSVAAEFHVTSASPVTQMNWTRTGKSFDVLEARDQGGKFLRLDPKDVRLSGGKSKKPIQITLRDTQGPIHLVSRLERNPLFVHRHLAVISTVKAAGVGRLVEVYHQASRVMGRDLGIDLEGTSDAALRVVTFETLARPLGLNTPLVGMQSATFDLFAVIGDKYQDDDGQRPIGLSFTYRPLGDSGGNSDLISLAFKLAISDGRSSSFTIDIDDANRAKGLTAVHFAVVDKKISWVCVFEDGSTQSKANIAAAFPLNQATIAASETVEVTPENFKNASGAITVEYWGDISMLTIPARGESSSFSWNWLFTGRNLEPADAVTATNLVNIAEAEARIIAISPPMPVVD